MCLLVFRWSPAQSQRLVLVGNRDEFHERPTAPMHWWDAPRLLAGRDLQAGGTWLAAGDDGRFGVVTNYRSPATPPGGPSRGALIPRFFDSGARPREYLDALARDAHAYAGFSLLVGDEREVAYYSNHDPDGARTLAPGTYGLSNGLLDTPWPKLVRTRERFAAVLAAAATTPARPATAAAVRSNAVPQALLEPLFELMSDRAPAPDHALPDTGLGAERERFLSSPFIVSPHYGTRCTTVVAYDADGALLAAERTYAADGRPVDTRRFLPQAAPA